MRPIPPSENIFRRMTWLTLMVTIVLTTGLGGAVTSAEVGMAYPTWPNLNGWSLFNFFYADIAEQFGIGASLEHTHRQAGTLLGLLSIFLFVVAWRPNLRESYPNLRRLAAINLILVIVQGLLGAFRVLGNVQVVAIFHAIGAQAIVVCLVALLKNSRTRPAPANSPMTLRVQLWSLVGLFLLFLNLLAAASLRHKLAAFSGHLVLALLTTGVLMYAVRLSFQASQNAQGLRTDAKRLLHFLGAQVALGIATWFFILGPLASNFENDQNRFLVQNILATSHLVVGMCVMGAAAALFLESRKSLRYSPNQV